MSREYVSRRVNALSDYVAPRNPIPRGKVISFGKRQLERTDGATGITRAYPLIDEIQIGIAGHRHLFTVTPECREWDFKTGHAAIRNTIA